MEAAAVRGGSLVRARAALAYGGARGPRRFVGAGLAAPRRRRALVALASHPEPLEPSPSLAQEGAVAVAQADEEEVHGDGAAADSAETSSPPSVPGKAVVVRFVLKKQCPFGQSFQLVGDDPALGLWDPSKAVALEWAEGHDWIVEKDLPANKLIEFKFLLQDSSGKLHWQNGPNRRLQTGETANTLVIYEDWGDVKKQKIAEEGEASIRMEEAIVSDDGESGKDIVLEDELQMDDDQEVKEDESIVGMDDEKPAVATNVYVQGQSVKENEANPQESMMHEKLKILDELHEKDTENGSASCSDESYAEKTEEDNILCEDGVPVENGLTSHYEHDLLWGWKALQQLVMRLGFKMDTT
ncbi:uncharacterized protein LOC133928980 isoform X2 [Phragmites australis]|uniref:uncharacterized protein LOC133928980 isoform X2 n=1 Tax=Phragmites australis TaxID=29695 RepID=UPI002D79FE92|nr:uncharacterized protein LOC133928980 isoform X2 [Phragmites australis]